MIFVVNDLTWFEQKYLAMLHQNYVQCKKHKEPVHSDTSACFRLAAKPVHVRRISKYCSKNVSDVNSFSFSPIEACL